MMQTWLLAACVFFGIISGDQAEVPPTKAPGLFCRWCTVWGRGQGCYPPRTFCKAAENGVCLVQTLYNGGDQWVQKVKSCYKDNSKCDTEGTDPETGFQYKYRCCSKGKNCSKSM